MEEISTSGIREITSLSEIPPWAYDSTPTGGENRFVVITGPLGYRKDEHAEAFRLAAIEALKLHGIYISAKELLQTGDSNFGYAYKNIIRYIDEDEYVNMYLDSVELDKMVYTPSGTIARFIYTGSQTDLDIPLTQGNPPEWIVKTPERQGYLFAVGSVGRHKNWKTGFDDADKKAYIKMLLTAHAELDSITKDNNSEKRQYAIETLFTRGEGTLKDMQIISRWAEEDGSQFYSLAAMPIQ